MNAALAFELCDDGIHLCLAVHVTAACFEAVVGVDGTVIGLHFYLTHGVFGFTVLGIVLVCQAHSHG